MNFTKQRLLSSFGKGSYNSHTCHVKVCCVRGWAMGVFILTYKMVGEGIEQARFHGGEGGG